MPAHTQGAAAHSPTTLHMTHTHTHTTRSKADLSTAGPYQGTPPPRTLPPPPTPPPACLMRRWAAEQQHTGTCAKIWSLCITRIRRSVAPGRVVKDKGEEREGGAQGVQETSRPPAWSRYRHRPAQALPSDACSSHRASHHSSVCACRCTRPPGQRNCAAASQGRAKHPPSPPSPAGAHAHAHAHCLPPPTTYTAYPTLYNSSPRLLYTPSTGRRPPPPAPCTLESSPD